MTSPNKHFKAYVVVVLALLPTTAAAAVTYQPLVGIPGLSNASTDFGAYINQLYLLSISLAALLAVIKIIIAGVKWMLSDVVTSKADAKKEIWGSITGLVIILAAFVVLNTINPNLTNLNVLSGAAPLTPLSPPTSPPPSIQVGGRAPMAIEPGATAGSGALNATNPEAGGRVPVPELTRFTQECARPTNSGQAAGRVTYTVRVCEPNPTTNAEECRLEQRPSANSNAATQITRVECTR